MRVLYGLVLVFALSASAMAAGGGNGGGGGTGGQSGNGGGGNTGPGGNDGQERQVKTCKKGSIYDRRTKSCVAKSSLAVPQSEILAQAWVLAKSGHFEDGRDLFALVAEREPLNPEALNGLGYTNRKLGFFDIAFVYYNRALDLDPNYLDAREYLGEGYAIAGKIDLAKTQLAEIAQRGGTKIEQYEELSEAIEKAVKSAATK